MAKFLRCGLGLVAIGAALIGTARGTGFYGPSDYLANGGTGVTATPEFYWELETKRLARDYHPTEKLFVTGTDATPADETDPPSIGILANLSDLTADIDIKDFAAAIKEGRIKPPDPALAIKQNGEVRDSIAAANDKINDPLPAEFASEFADYHRGAYAYRLGPAHYAEARKAWEELLARPAAERHDRSVWAAFMLGKLALKQGNPDAVKWFEMTRRLAKEGFADSLGMAADSYGWEGRSEWKQGHPEKAAPLYLNQLALGARRAIVSLIPLLPDRLPVDGMLNFGTSSDDVSKWTDEQKKAVADAEDRAVKAAAADPLLRRLVTAHILATETGYASEYLDPPSDDTPSRSAKWLAAIKEAKPDQLADAEYLGWITYNNGDYKEAARWLDLAKADAPAALWLRAKLQLRDGKLDDAAKSLAQAWAILRSPTAYTGWNPSGVKEPDAAYDYSWTEGGWSFPETASGDLAQLHLARNDFIQSLETFDKGGIWPDAAFVAERVLTADELKAYVDKQPTVVVDESQYNHLPSLRYLLGRRLVREDRYDEAAVYLQAPYNKILEAYVKALKDGANEKLSKQDRAKAWFTAGWIARYDGMELMGTEAAPDGFDSEGGVADVNVPTERLAGKYETNVVESGTEKMVSKPMPMPPTKEEKQRLEKNKIRPDVRYHYRNIASALALKAAALMKDNSEELADVLNTAGEWVKSTDEKSGFRIYKIIQTRCPKTDVGKASQGKDWFFDDPAGPWSDDAKSAYDALHAQVGLKKDE